MALVFLLLEAEDSGAQPAAAAHPSLSPQATESLRSWLLEQSDARGRRCDVRFLLPVNLGVLAACGPAGLWTLAFDTAGTPIVVDVQELQGDVVGLFWEGERIWAKVSHLEAHPVELRQWLPPAAPAASAPAPIPPSARPSELLPFPELPRRLEPPSRTEPPPSRVDRTNHGRVVQVSTPTLDAVVALGRADGIELDQVIQFSTEVEQQLGAEVIARQEPVARGVVTEHGELFSRVTLGLNERVEVGALAQPLPRSAKLNLIAPTPARDVWEVEAIVRPFLALGQLGGGLLVTGNVGRRYEGNLHLWLDVDPLGFADVESEDSLLSAAGRVLVSYDSPLLEVGLGLGAQTVNSVDSGLERGSGFNFAQMVRLGAVDGLLLSLRSDVVLFHREFSFSGLTGTGQIPVGYGTWLVLRGGGGDAGYGFGELGLKTLLQGNGSSGSLFLHVVAGGVVLFRSVVFREQTSATGVPLGFTTEPSLDAGGPMAGVGLGWRL